jgi:hypothetical protein
MSQPAVTEFRYESALHKMEADMAAAGISQSDIFDGDLTATLLQACTKADHLLREKSLRPLVVMTEGTDGATGPSRQMVALVHALVFFRERTAFIWARPTGFELVVYN